MPTSQEERRTLDLQLPTTRTRVISKREVINNLPDEILSYIFNICVAKLPGWLKTVADKSRTRASPLLVAQVCYRWRQVAIATPSLWTFLAFSDKRLCEFPIERLWLQRSKACLLDVQIDEDFRTNVFIDGVFDILLPHFHRVRAFSILFFDIPPVQIFFNRFPTFSAVLSEFRLVHRRDGPNFQEQFRKDYQTPLLVDGAPQLKHVAFTAIFADWNTFPFVNLESLYLTMTNCTWEQFANWPKAIPRLRTLKMHLSGPDDEHQPENWPQEIISFPVTTFHFGSEDPDILEETLKRVVFPNIMDVALICVVEMDTSTILDMLSRRQPFVTADRLHIEGFSCPARSLTDKMLLSSLGFPNITRLFLRDCSQIFHALAEGRHPCFPRLERLVTYYSAGVTIRSIVEARKEHKISPLSFVRVRRARTTTTEQGLDWLEENIKDVKIRLMIDEEYASDYDDCISGEEDHGYGEKLEGAHPSYLVEDYIEEDGIEEDDIEEDFFEADVIDGHGTEPSDSEDVM